MPCLSAPMFSFHLTFKTGTFISKDSFEQWVAIIIFLYMLRSEMFFCLKTIIFNQIILYKSNDTMKHKHDSI